MFILNHLVPPTVTFPAALLAIQGGMVSCSARGTPPIYTALIRNSTVLVNKTNTATIRLYKDGNYTCQATNQYGTDIKELQVNFTSKRFSSGLISLFLSSTIQCLRFSLKETSRKRSLGDKRQAPLLQKNEQTADCKVRFHAVLIVIKEWFLTIWYQYHLLIQLTSHTVIALKDMS